MINLVKSWENVRELKKIKSIERETMLALKMVENKKNQIWQFNAFVNLRLTLLYEIQCTSWFSGLVSTTYWINSWKVGNNWTQPLESKTLDFPPMAKNVFRVFLKILGTWYLAWPVHPSKILSRYAETNLSKGCLMTVNVKWLGIEDKSSSSLRGLILSLTL